MTDLVDSPADGIENAAQEQKAPPRLVQEDMFGPARVLNESRRSPRFRIRVRPETLLSEIPLLESLAERPTRGRPTKRIIGMPHSLWVYLGRWNKTHREAKGTSQETMAAFLARNRVATLDVRRQRLAGSLKEQETVRTEWVTIKQWKDLTVAEEQDWKRRIRLGQTNGTYRVTLRGLQKLEVVR